MQPLQRIYFAVSLISLTGLNGIQVQLFLPCMPRTVDFIIKNIDVIISFACLVGWLDPLPVGIKKKTKAQSFKNCLGWHEYRHARALTRATILGTLCIRKKVDGNLGKHNLIW